MENEVSLEAWDQVEKPENDVTLDAMDNLIRELAIARDDYDQMHARLKEQATIVDNITDKVIKILQANRKTSYKLDGVANVVVKTRESYRTPKTDEDKQLLFAYIQDKYGAQALTRMMSINSATLNSWANEEANTGVMQIPGLGQPTVTPILSVTRKN